MKIEKRKRLRERKINVLPAKWREIMLDYIKGMDVSSLDELEQLGAFFMIRASKRIY